MTASGEQHVAAALGGRSASPEHGDDRTPGAHAAVESACVAYRALAVTASNRAAAGTYQDTGGPLIVRSLRSLGFEAEGPQVVSDGEPVETALRTAVAAGYDVVLTTGGTGLSPTDLTPEMTRRVIDHEVPGIAEAIRAAGRETVPTAALSRGLAGVAGRTLIVNLPGSSGGVRDGLGVLEPLLRHAVAQLHGEDHPQPPRRSTGEPVVTPPGVGTSRQAAESGARDGAGRRSGG